MALSESDRITITKYPPLPSSCAICLFSADGQRGFLDFQMSLDYYGAVVICEECVAPVAQLFGYVPESELEEIGIDLAATKLDLERTRERHAELERTLDSLFAFRPSLIGNDSVADEKPVESATEDPGQPELPIRASGEDDSATSEPTSKRRPKNVSQFSL